MYNKLFTKILDSSIWMEPVSTRIVWITFLAAMDENGFVQFASIPNVAHRAVVSLEEASKAVATLEAPDANSSDPDNEGRRIERVPGGWMVLNAQKYRALVTREIIKEQTKDRVRRFRDAKGGNAPVTGGNACVTPGNACVTPGNAPVTQGNHSVTPSETDTVADTKAKEEAVERPPKIRRKRRDSDPELTDEQWMESIRSNPKNQGKDIEGLQKRLFKWCQEKGETPTRRRFEVWLEKEQPVLKLNQISKEDPRGPFTPQPERGLLTWEDYDNLRNSY